MYCIQGSQSIRAKFRSLPTLRLAGSGSGEKSRSHQRRHSTPMGSGALSWGRRSSLDGGLWLSASRQTDTTAIDKDKSVERPQSSPPRMSHVQWSTTEGPRCPAHGHHPVTTKCTECQVSSTTPSYGYDNAASGSQQRDLSQTDGSLNIPPALHRGNSSVSSLRTQDIRQDTATASRISLPDEAEAGPVQHSGEGESARFSLVAAPAPSGSNTRSQHEAVNSSAEVNDTDTDMAWKDRYRNVLNRISVCFCHYHICISTLIHHIQYAGSSKTKGQNTPLSHHNHNHDNRHRRRRRHQPEPIKIQPQTQIPKKALQETSSLPPK